LSKIHGKNETTGGRDANPQLNLRQAFAIRMRPRVERKKVKARIRQGIKKPKTAAPAAYRRTFGFPAILKILAKK
jgi:hypothetical protein